jgi:hypothetical protein
MAKIAKKQKVQILGFNFWQSFGTFWTYQSTVGPTDASIRIES